METKLATLVLNDLVYIFLENTLLAIINDIRHCLNKYYRVIGAAISKADLRINTCQFFLYCHVKIHKVCIHNIIVGYLKQETTFPK